MQKASRTIVYRTTTVAMAVALLIICSWASIPFTVGITLQTFAVFFISACFSVKISLSAVISYVLLGLIGVPVFSGFNGGISALLGPSGGYLIGFALSTVIISTARSFYIKTPWAYVASMVASLTVCYTAGCLWYRFVFAPDSALSLTSVLAVCVIPFILPDTIKALLALIMFKRLYPYIQKIHRSSGGTL